MELELLTQRICLARLMPQTCWMFKEDKITLDWAQGTCVPKGCLQGQQGSSHYDYGTGGHWTGN